MFHITKKTTCEEEIKKSRFIVRAAPVATVDAAMDFLKQVRKEKATHHCWAFRIGDQYRSSDDGEPSGTAGRPILGAIEHQDIDQVMVVVTRHYGGIKLGTGGLVRAYGGCAAKCLQQAPKKPVVATVEMNLNVPFDQIGILYPLMEQFGAAKLEENYSDTGFTVRLRINQADQRVLVDMLTNASGGRIKYSAHR